MSSELLFTIYPTFRKKHLLALEAGQWMSSNSFEFDIARGLQPTAMARIPESMEEREALWQQFRGLISGRFVRIFDDEDALNNFLAVMARSYPQHNTEVGA